MELRHFLLITSSRLNNNVHPVIYEEGNPTLVDDD